VVSFSRLFEEPLLFLNFWRC